MATPDYVLTAPYEAKEELLQEGTFVRPIHTSYVPAHVRERFKDFNKQTHVFCYTRIGIVPILKSRVQKT